jgi:hypothetical protein
MLDDLQERIEKLQAFDFGEELREIVVGNTQTIRELQAEQMEQGLDVDGQPVELDGYPGYHPSTILHKERFGVGIGAITEHVTRYQTGTLYSELQVDVDGDEFTITSEVPYWGYLLDRTTEKGTGLDEEMRLRFAEEVTLPSIATTLEEKTGITL